jgi:hypothetical protein
VRLKALVIVMSLVVWALALGAAIASADGGGSTAGGVSAGAPSEVVLMRGDRGPAVKRVQRRLHRRADGVYGRSTERAVRRFQRRRGLEPDGVVGPETRRALHLRPFSHSSVHRRHLRLPRVLRVIAKCESGGDPTAVSEDGRYRGKFQFTRSTWKLLGGDGDPAEAPEWMQDKLALKLYRKEGVGPWGACGRAATSDS